MIDNSRQKQSRSCYCMQLGVYQTRLCLKTKAKVHYFLGGTGICGVVWAIGSEVVLGLLACLSTSQLCSATLGPGSEAESLKGHSLPPTHIPGKF